MQPTTHPIQATAEQGVLRAALRRAPQAIPHELKDKAILIYTAYIVALDSNPQSAASSKLQAQNTLRLIKADKYDERTLEMLIALHDEPSEEEVPEAAQL